MKKLGFIVLGILVLAGLAAIALQMTAPSPLESADRETFERANQLYLAGNYAVAASLYEQRANAQSSAGLFCCQPQIALRRGLPCGNGNIGRAHRAVNPARHAGKSLRSGDFNTPCLA